MENKNRTEGEYPFYPQRPDHEVLKTVQSLETFDEETNQVKFVVDYSAGVSKTFQ